MSRPTLLPMLCLASALLIAATAHGMSPARQGPNSSGGSCPETQVAVEAEAGDASATPSPEATAANGAATPPAVKPSAATRPRSGARWHSFLPGMFK